jgi:CRP-like cAMP-binding protein
MRPISFAPTPDDIALLAANPVFAAVPRPDLLKILEGATVHILQDRSTLFVQGDPARDIWAVMSGWVKLYRLTPNGDEAVIHIFSQGQLFAEPVALLDKLYPASGETVGEARILKLPAVNIRRAIEGSPVIALSMVASTSMHLHHLVSQIEELKAQTAITRVARFIMSLCPPKGEGRILDKKFCIDLPFEKQLLAAKLGVQPESLSRAFRKLREQGVEVDGKTVTVNSIAELRALAEA